MKIDKHRLTFRFSCIRKIRGRCTDGCDDKFTDAREAQVELLTPLNMKNDKLRNVAISCAKDKLNRLLPAYTYAYKLIDITPCKEDK